jgi:hypothetical protein
MRGSRIAGAIHYWDLTIAFFLSSFRLQIMNPMKMSEFNLEELLDMRDADECDPRDIL